MIIVMDSASGLKRFLEKTPLNELARQMLFRMVLAFLTRRGRMSCSQAAGSVASQAIHRGELTRFLARPRWQKHDFNGPLRAALLKRESRRGKFLFLIDATLVSQAGKKTENTYSTGNRGRHRAKKRRYNKKKVVFKTCHSFTFGLLITPSGIRIPFQIPHYTQEYCAQHDIAHRTTAESAADMIRTLPLPPGAEVVVLGDTQDAPAKNEQELIPILRPDAPAAERALACKHLSVHGSSDAVPDLARLLADQRLVSWARIALKVIPGAAADEALRKASDSLRGKLLVGAINSIGVRRDAQAVDLLTARVRDQDAEVASAAAVALGRIGNAAAAKSLRQTLAGAPVKVRSAVAEGCVLCAERFLSEGNSAQAVQIYDEVRKADVPKQRMLEATRGAILARREEGIPLLVEQFRSPDKGLLERQSRASRQDSRI